MKLIWVSFIGIYQTILFNNKKSRTRIFVNVCGNKWVVNQKVWPIAKVPKDLDGKNSNEIGCWVHVDYLGKYIWRPMMCNCWVLHINFSLLLINYWYDMFKYDISWVWWLYCYGKSCPINAKVTIEIMNMQPEVPLYFIKKL